MNDRPPTRVSRLSLRGLTPDQQFWQLWRHGSRPDLVAFLAARPHLPSSEIASVIAIDQYERWLGGDRVAAEEYVRLLPCDGQHDQALCDIVYGEYLLREQLGEHPDPEDYQQRFPAVAGLLRRQLELHQALADVEADEPAETSENHPQQTGYTRFHPETGRRLAGDRGTAHRSGLPRATVRGLPPPEVPGFTLQEVLGKGGMGVVYKARQVSLNRDVALKLLPVLPESDPDAVERMRREAQITARLSHPNIVTVFDAALIDGWFYLAMEYVPGIDLHRLVDQRGPLDVAQAREYVRQAALGLQHAHAQGLVHRDIKPSNLIVSPVPDASGYCGTAPGTVKILDLGLARLSAEPEAGQARITQVGAFMGTPDFIAPEQASDPRNADVRSDLYSLGCTLYFLLTGQPPFSGATALATLMQHHVQDVPPIEQLRKDVPAELLEVVRRLLAKRPQDRFQSPAELIQALAGSRPVAAQASPPPATPPAAGRRPRLLQTLVGHEDWVKDLAFSERGVWLASGSLDGSVRLWRPETGELVWNIAHTAGVLGVAVSADGRWLAAVGQDRFLYLYDVPAQRLCWKVPAHERNVDQLAFMHSVGPGAGLLSAGHDGILRLWDVPSGNLTRTWQGHAGAVWGLAPLPDGKTALSGGQDRSLRLWNVAAGTTVGLLPEPLMPVTCVEVSRDGQLALSGGADGQIHLWDLPGRRLLRTLVGHQGRVTDVALSPDARTAVSASRDQTLRLWDVESGVAGEVLSGDTAWVTSVAWSADGRYIASGSVNRKVCLWELAGES